MSAFLKIPIQFFILLMGVLVFVFYQFTAPPIVFNANEIAKAEQNPQFQTIQQNYENAFNERREAAIKMVEATKIFTLAESLGGVESLIEVPAAMTHLSVAGSHLS